MTEHVIGIAVAAVLLFWTVGAYNRLVRLRSDIVERFGTLDALFRERHALLERQVELLGARLTSAGPRLEALRAACRQVEAARAVAAARPGRAGAITSLRVAESILADARARLPLPAGAPRAGAGPTGDDGELPDVSARIAEHDSTLRLARRDFNAAVTGYNHAVRQFPTLLLARLFGFRPVGAL